MAGMAEGKAAVITGAARGIGRAAAVLFAKEGADVLVSDILGEEGEETAELVRAEGRKGHFIACDTSDEDQVIALMAGAAENFGRLDCLVNNAGVEGHIAPIVDSDTEQFDRLVSINLRGVWLCIKHAVPHMRHFGNGGSIVNLSSLAGNVGYAGLAPYVMSKHGVNGITKASAIEYSAEGIRTNSVSPGCIQTDMIDKLADALGAPSAAEALAPLHPIGRLGTSEEVAEAIVWLCSNRASNVTGTQLRVDGGFTAQ
ncbi:glucose 1-dehydrogenase [Altererythrobacter sp. MF3-039]|uniref:glucose 1-dehydrogenase n=1 Tax=Altererythrobacter sp. MF3-039 TaxID=3252901 RepID=UPI00390CCB2D